MREKVILLSFTTLIFTQQQTGRTALMVASYDGHDKVVNELLQANADVNLCDKVCFSYVNTVYEPIL